MFTSLSLLSYKHLKYTFPLTAKRIREMLSFNKLFVTRSIVPVSIFDAEAFLTLCIVCFSSAENYVIDLMKTMSKRHTIFIL